MGRESESRPTMKQRSLSLSEKTLRSVTESGGRAQEVFRDAASPSAAEARPGRKRIKEEQAVGIESYDDLLGIGAWRERLIPCFVEPFLRAFYSGVVRRIEHLKV